MQYVLHTRLSVSTPVCFGHNVMLRAKRLVVVYILGKSKDFFLKIKVGDDTLHASVENGFKVISTFKL